MIFGKSREERRKELALESFKLQAKFIVDILSVAVTAGEITKHRTDEGKNMQKLEQHFLEAGQIIMVGGAQMYLTCGTAVLATAEDWKIAQEHPDTILPARRATSAVQS